MQKAILERFVAKYYLSGAGESVTWVTSGGTLKTKFMSNDRNVLGSVETSELSFDDGDYAINDTTNFKSLLGVLGDEIEVKVNTRGNRVISLGLHDALTKVTYALASPDVIPSVMKPDKMPDWDGSDVVVLKLDDQFHTTFVKGKNALPDSDKFTVVTEDGVTKIVLGYSSQRNTSRVAFTPDLQSGTDLLRPIQFSANYMKEILLANKDAKSGILKVSPRGVAYCTFDVDGFEVEYYLIGLKSKNGV